jgi:hypothetical protein
MREIRTSGLMSGDGKRDDLFRSAPALILDSTLDASVLICERHGGFWHTAARGIMYRTENLGGLELRVRRGRKKQRTDKHKKLQKVCAEGLVSLDLTL